MSNRYTNCIIMEIILLRDVPLEPKKDRLTLTNWSESRGQKTIDGTKPLFPVDSQLIEIVITPCHTRWL